MVFSTLVPEVSFAMKRRDKGDERREERREERGEKRRKERREERERSGERKPLVTGDANLTIMLR